MWPVKAQTCSGKIFEVSDCLGLHFSWWRKKETEWRVVERKSKSSAPSLDLLKI